MLTAGLRFQNVDYQCSVIYCCGLLYNFLTRVGREWDEVNEACPDALYPAPAAAVPAPAAGAVTPEMNRDLLAAWSHGRKQAELAAAAAAAAGAV